MSTGSETTAIVTASWAAAIAAAADWLDECLDCGQVHTFHPGETAFTAGTWAAADGHLYRRRSDHVDHAPGQALRDHFGVR